MGRCAMDRGCWRRVGRGCWRRQEASTRSWSSSEEGLDARAPPQGPPTPLALAPLTILIARRRTTEPERERPAARSPQKESPASRKRTPEPRRSPRLSPLASRPPPQQLPAAAPRLPASRPVVAAAAAARREEGPCGAPPSSLRARQSQGGGRGYLRSGRMSVRDARERTAGGTGPASISLALSPWLASLRPARKGEREEGSGGVAIGGPSRTRVVLPVSPRERGGSWGVSTDP